MGLELWLLDLTAVRQAVVLDLQFPFVGKVFVVVADPFADTTQDYRATIGQGGFQQDISAVVGKIKPAAGVEIVGTKIHAAFVDDKQILQRIDEASLAGVV